MFTKFFQQAQISPNYWDERMNLIESKEEQFALAKEIAKREEIIQKVVKAWQGGGGFALIEACKEAENNFKNNK